MSTSIVLALAAACFFATTSVALFPIPGMVEEKIASSDRTSASIRGRIPDGVPFRQLSLASQNDIFKYLQSTGIFRILSEFERDEFTINFKESKIVPKSGDSVSIGRTLHSIETVDDDFLSPVDLRPWSRERIVSFLMAAVTHVLESPNLSASRCDSEEASLKSVTEDLLEAQKQIIQSNFHEAQMSAAKASVMLKKCHLSLSKKKADSTLNVKELNAALKDGLYKINVLMTTLESLHNERSTQ